MLTVRATITEGHVRTGGAIIAAQLICEVAVVHHVYPLVRFDLLLRLMMWP